MPSGAAASGATIQDPPGAAGATVPLTPQPGSASLPGKGKPPRPKPKSPTKAMARVPSYGLPHPSALLSKPISAPVAPSTSQGRGLRGTWLPTTGVLLLWMLHEHLQRQQFKHEGFAFGRFTSFIVQVACAAIAAVNLCLELRRRANAQNIDDPSGKGNLTRPLLTHIGRSGIDSLADAISLAIHYFAVVGFLLAANSFYSIAIGHANKTAQVLFKSCKLVPTMLTANLVGAASHSYLDFGIAVLFVCSVMVFMVGDCLAAAAVKDFVGPLLLLLGVCLDSVVPNVEEILLCQFGRSKQELIFCLCSMKAAIGAAIMLPTGEATAACVWFAQQKSLLPAAMVALQSLAAYFGIYLYLTLLVNASSKVAVMTTTCSKVATGAVSVMLFSKQGTWQHGVGLCMLVGSLLVNAIFGSEGRQPSRRAGSGKIVDIGAILGPSFGQLGKVTDNLRGLTMEKVSGSKKSKQSRQLRI